MSDTRYALCNCNGTAALDDHGLRQTVPGGSVLVGQALCRREVGLVRTLFAGDAPVVIAG